MKTEASLQNKIQRYMEDHGYYCPHLSPPNHPGFPDLIVCAGYKFRMIEVKDFTKIGPGEKMKAIFKPSQPPFYGKMMGKHSVFVTVVGYLGEKTMWFEFRNITMIHDLFELGRDDYLSKYGNLLGPLGVLEP